MRQVWRKICDKVELIAIWVIFGTGLATIGMALIVFALWMCLER